VEEPVAVVRSADALPVDLSHNEVQALHAADDIVVIDVRQEWEFAEGHIPGAQLIPLNELSDRLHEIPTEERVVLVCRSGNRSHQARQLLTQEGFDNVHNMLGGMQAWQNAGYEMKR
jgi:rhodanese-related sulfurtransferase